MKNKPVKKQTKGGCSQVPVLYSVRSKRLGRGRFSTIDFPLAMSPTEASGSLSEFLQRIFNERRKRNASYSLRAFARDLGISHTHLSMVMHSKKLLGIKAAIQFCERLKLSSTERTEFLHLVSQASAVLIKQTQKKTSTTKYQSLDMDKFKLISEWYHLAILELTLVKHFQAEEKWIAKELGISVKQTTEAIERLFRLGLLESKAKTWKKRDENLAIPTPPDPQEALKHFHRQMAEFAIDKMSVKDKQEFGRRSITGMMFPVDITKLEKARRKIERFSRALADYLYTPGDSSTVYHLNVQLFPLSKS